MKSQLSTDGFAGRLAVFYAAFFVLSGLHLLLFPVWLADRGLNPREIGIVLAVPMLVRVTAIPLVTRFADSRELLRESIVLLSVASAAGFALVATMSGFLPILFAVLIAAIPYVPTMPLTEAYAMQGLSLRARHYGPVRLWGSGAFIAANLAAGIALDGLAPRHLIWPIVAASVGVALCALLLRSSQRIIAETGPMAPVRILRDRPLLMLMIAASLIQSGHGVYYGFSAIAWSAAGLSGMTVGVLWGLGVAAEIALFALAGKLPPRITPLALVIAGGLGGALRWLAMAYDPPLALLAPLQILHAFSFGATHLGALAFIHRAVPARQGATAQGYFSIALGLGMAASVTLAGALYAAFGARAYLAMAIISVAGSALALLTRPRLPIR